MPSIDESFRILGLSDAASEIHLRTAYRRLIIAWHPDKHGSDPELQAKATEVAKQLNTAFEYLSELFEQGILPARPEESARSAVSSHQHGRQQSADRDVRHWSGGAAYQPGFPDPSVSEVFVKSSNIVSAGYNRNSRILFLKFIGGAVYQYFGVPSQLFEEFLNASSHGRFAHEVIYDRFPYQRCE